MMDDHETPPDDSPHGLQHVQFMSGKWTPACRCGWYSIDGAHWRFEVHMQGKEPAK